MRARFILLAAAIAAAPLSAQAAILNYGCQGQLGEQQVFFDREALFVVRGTELPKFSADKFSDTIAAAKESKNLLAKYEPADAGGLDETVKFMRMDDESRRVTLTEKSSRRVSHKHRMICWRNEETDVYRKTYRYEREHEPARDITMQCYEYQLSTKGGHEGCD